jgi:hypothetical protein
LANPDARFGLRPVRHIDGSAWNGQTIRCYVSASYAVALFIGDPVDFETTAANIPTAMKYPSVIRSAFTDGTYAVGVITSFDPNPDNLTQQYRPASQARYCQVCLCEDVVFQIRDDGAAALTKSTSIGLNAVGILTHSGDTITGLSGFELDTSSDAPAVDASNTMLILKCADIEDNAWDGSTDTHVVWEVLINMNRLKHTTNGALGVLNS